LELPPFGASLTALPNPLIRLFGNSPEFWMNAQRAVDLYDAATAQGRRRANQTPPGSPDDTETDNGAVRHDNVFIFDVTLTRRRSIRAGYDDTPHE
jgi:hypothetical protein